MIGRAARCSTTWEFQPTASSYLYILSITVLIAAIVT